MIDSRFYGVHLNSAQFDKIKEARKKNLFTIISAHTFEEIKKAQNFGADAVTFSPVFFSPNKGNPLGVEKLKEAINIFPHIKIFALGGIVSDKEVFQIKESRAYGFASIRYFSVK